MTATAPTTRPTRARRRRFAGSVGNIVVSRRRIAGRVRSLAAEIDRCYRGQDLTVVVVLTGAMVFAADLVRRLATPLRLAPVEASSYPGAATRSNGRVRCGAMPASLAGRNVLVLDDILDSGRTLSAILRRVRRHRPRTLRTCVLLRKRRGRAVALTADWVGFDIPDVFVVGYGLDYDNRLRNLPDIRALRIAPGKDPS